MSQGSQPNAEGPRTHAQIARLRIALLALAAGWAGSFAWLATRVPPAPAVLAVERLEIVEADGTPAFVFANSQRPAPATIDGQLLMENQEEERRGVPSIIFYDGKGDEVGGMLLGARETEGGGFQATRHLSLDGYKQDQTIVLSHYQNATGSSAGLRISDRPWDLSILDVQERLGLGPAPSREAMQAAIAALPEEGRNEQLREWFGSQRVFLGSTRDRDALLSLNDGAGRPRVLIQVPETGEPSLQFLDEEGEVVGRLPR